MDKRTLEALLKGEPHAIAMRVGLRDWRLALAEQRRNAKRVEAVLLGR